MARVLFLFMGPFFSTLFMSVIKLALRKYCLGLIVHNFELRKEREKFRENVRFIDKMVPKIFTELRAKFR